MKRWLNFQKSINTTHKINWVNKENYIVISTDAEKNIQQKSKMNSW